MEQILLATGNYWGLRDAFQSSFCALGVRSERTLHTNIGRPAMHTCGVWPLKAHLLPLHMW